MPLPLRALPYPIWVITSHWQFITARLKLSSPHKRTSLFIRLIIFILHICIVFLPVRVRSARMLSGHRESTEENGTFCRTKVIDSLSCYFGDGTPKSGPLVGQQAILGARLHVLLTTRPGAQQATAQESVFSPVGESVKTVLLPSLVCTQPRLVYSKDLRRKKGFPSGIWWSWERKSLWRLRLFR